MSPTKTKVTELPVWAAAQFEPWVRKWTQTALSTAPMTGNDRYRTAVAIRKLYRYANCKPPARIIFVPSPLVGAAASGFAAGLLYLHRASAVDSAVDSAVRSAVDSAVRSAVHSAVDSAVDSAVHSADWWEHGPTLATIAKSLAPQDSTFLLECAGSAWSLWQGGNMWPTGAAYVSFLRDVLLAPLDLDDSWAAWEQAVIHSGPRFVHEKFCMVSDRPEVLHVDDRGRSHCETGPFVRWRDGSALYAIHGVRVPSDIVERPGSITTQRIDAQQNAEVRRIMINRYGQARYLVDSQAVELHRDDFGVLYQKPIPNDEPLTMVKVVNSTPEPDGSFKDYFLRVDPRLRPLPPGEWTDDRKREWLQNQKPQEATARNAVASTFGKRGEDYAPEFQS